MIRAKYKITGEKPNIENILSKLPIIDYKYSQAGDELFLEVIVSNQEIIGELLRRLKPKLNRKNTQVDLLSREATVDSKFSCFKEKATIRNIGWRSRIHKKGHSFYITINKVVFVGNNLKPGTALYCYESIDNNGRPIMITYLDGVPRDEAKEIDIVSYNTFIEKQSEALKEVNKKNYKIKHNRFLT